MSVSEHKEGLEALGITPVPESEDDVSGLSWFQSVRRVLSNRNWAIYLGTVWIYSSMGVLNQYFTLYFRDIGVSYIMIGIVISLMFVVNMLGTTFTG